MALRRRHKMVGGRLNEGAVGGGDFYRCYRDSRLTKIRKKKKEGEKEEEARRHNNNGKMR